MGSTRNTCLNTSDQSTNPRPQQTRASLPPKPVGLKRTRNPSSTATPIVPPSHVAHSARPRRSWTRRSASWTPEEDAKLIELVRKETSVPPSITASKTWSRVAAQLTNRTGKQCRERYLNQLKPGIRRDPWSPEEERILHEAHARYGNKWVTIASQLPGRTDNCVKNHWNSMLRKRQRREAALRATEDARNPKLPSVPQISADSDLKGDADLSLYTGCATPSGASSSNHEVPTSSGVPSPFVASSPITPKRDIKLQISSLVATSSKEVPAWKGPYLSRKLPSRPQSPGRSLHESPQAQTSPLSRRPHSPLSNPQDRTRPQTRSTTVLAGNPSTVFPFRYSTQDGKPLAMACSKQVEVHSVGTTVDGDPTVCDTAVFHRQLRRSARLTASAHDKVKYGSSNWTMKPSGLKKPASLTGNRRSEGSGNPLAALAAAASSVPPSPLTPESRFSGTSRSRSVSPCPRSTADLGRATSDGGTSEIKLSTEVTVAGIGAIGSHDVKRLENNNNGSLGKAIRGRELNEMNNAEGAETGPSN